MRAADGQAATSRPTTDGSATATFAARLAVLPITSKVHGNTPPRRPRRESASNDMDDETIIPSTEMGNSAAVHRVSPYADTRMYMCRYEITAAMAPSTTTVTVVVQRIS